MNVGVFSLIPWSFLDQRPQVVAKKLAEWGYNVTYFGTFSFNFYDSINPHPWEEYKSRSWDVQEINDRLRCVNPLLLPAHKGFQSLLHMNKDFMNEIKIKLKEFKFDFAIVIDPLWGRVMKELGIPFIYDHVDDTHHMSHCVKDFFYNEALYSEEHSILNIYIQPNISKRYNGLYIPNGITVTDLIYDPSIEKEYDAVCLSCFADWFDMDSVLATKKKILLIGPMMPDLQEKYYQYLRNGGVNVEWISEIPRKLASVWLNKAKVGIIPFKESHGVIDYVMPLKIVEYYYLGLPAVSYVNKGVMEEFGEENVHSYSSTGWLGYPDLDTAIENAMNDDRLEVRRKMSLRYSWDDVLKPLEDYIFTKFPATISK